MSDVMPVAGEVEEAGVRPELTLEQRLAAIEGKLAKDLSDAKDENARLKATLEAQEAKHIAKHPEAGEAKSIQVLGPLGPVDHLSRMAAPFEKDNPGHKFRFINTNPNLLSVRRGQGFEPVKDAKDQEIRYMDTVLASMPKERFKAEILAPRQLLKDHRRKAIAKNFHEYGKDLGVETEGTITFDKGE